MKKILIFLGLLCFLAGPVFAQETAVLKGTLIDGECFEAHKEEMAEYIKTHTKQCALECGGYSGYVIYMDGKAFKFDAQSTAQIEGFLKNEDSKLDVMATVQQFTDDLTLVSIENQKE